MDQNKAIENMSFEEALAELETIVKQIDSGEENLNRAIASFERGIKLKAHCQQQLDNARMKIEQINHTDEGIGVNAIK